MILIDTSVWIDYLRAGEDTGGALLASGRVWMYPFVIGELSLGNLCQRDVILTSLQDLPRAIVAADNQVLHFI